MSSAEDVRGFLDAHPAFASKVDRFMMLYDAADVLGEIRSPGNVAVAAYLREVGAGLMRDAGVPDEFVTAMIAARPPIGTSAPS